MTTSKKTPQGREAARLRANATRERNKIVQAEQREQFAAEAARERKADAPQKPLSDSDRERLQYELALNKKDTALIEEVLQSRRKLNRRIYDLLHPEGCFLPKQGYIGTLAQDLFMMEATSLGCVKNIGPDTVEIDLELLTTRKAEADAARVTKREAEPTMPLLPIRKKDKPATPDKPSGSDDNEDRIQ